MFNLKPIVSLNTFKLLPFTTARSEKKLHLGGIYPPLTTPFNKDESIAFDKLAANLTKYSKIPFAGYVVQGSNGEYPYLEKDEKLEIVKFVKDFIKESNKPLIAGSGCECKIDAVSRNFRACRLLMSIFDYSHQSNHKINGGNGASWS